MARTTGTATLAKSAKPVEALEPIEGVQFITEAEGKEILDRQAQKYLGMSGQEFIRRYRAGEIDDPNRREVTLVSMLIPLAGN